MSFYLDRGNGCSWPWYKIPGDDTREGFTRHNFQALYASARKASIVLTYYAHQPLALMAYIMVLLSEMALARDRRLAMVEYYRGFIAFVLDGWKASICLVTYL